MREADGVLPVSRTKYPAPSGYGSVLLVSTAMASPRILSGDARVKKKDFPAESAIGSKENSWNWLSPRLVAGTWTLRKTVEDAGDSLSSKATGCVLSRPE